ncbi:MAG TPA: hypothetical protein VI854_06535, partial [Acidimicrobiia bacterium]|nr:hypothetical protein [Acidimicrobiia bacterium]
GTLAFYSPETERVSVRGTELTLSVRATLVHELTHVAQDQHFDLGRIEDDEAGWLRTVVEGDAERVLSHWVDQLDPATKAAYDAEGDTAEAPDLAGIPEVLLAFFGAPYEFGYGFVEALTALGGNPSIDRALQNPPVSDEQVFDPFRYLARDVPLPVQAPVLRRGESKTGVDDGIPDDFGALTLFLMLSQRVDHREALRAVDGWGGDSYIGFERDGRRCVRLAVKGDTPADTDELTGTLDAWARSMPEGTASVKAHGGQAELTTCDPGPEFKLGAPQLGEAMSYPLLRTGAAIGLVGSGISWEESRCVAGGLSQRFTPDEFSMEGARGRAVKRAVQELVASCPP